MDELPLDPMARFIVIYLWLCFAALGATIPGNRP